MFKPLQLYIGLRYTRAKRRNSFISFISAISMVGIALGVTALITVISVMNGFEKEVRSRILGTVSHATISGVNGSMPQWQLAVDKAMENSRVVGAAPYIERETLLSGARTNGGQIRGVVPELEQSVSVFGDSIQYGSMDALKPGSFGIVLGSELALVLGVDVGDKVTVFAPQLRATPAGVIPRAKRFEVVGIFSVGYYEYDRGLGLIHLEDASKLFRFGGEVSGVRLKVTDMFKAWDVASELRNELPGLYLVRDWSQSHSSYFRAVKLEKTAMFVILSLIIAVAAFNIISTLVMVVTDKQADIAILRTIGASPASIMGIFVVLGLFIGVFGTALGLVGGVSLATHVDTLVPWLERSLGLQFLPPDMYYISEVPSEMRWSDVTRIGSLSFVLTVLATLYPAWRASRTDPAEALRYE